MISCIPCKNCGTTMTIQEESYLIDEVDSFGTCPNCGMRYRKHVNKKYKEEKEIWLPREN